MTDASLLHDDGGSTRLSPEERESLIPSYITFHHELNEAEQENILAAMRWLKIRRSWLTETEMVEEDFVCEVHRRMFNKVWRWAGDYRRTDKNIGVPFHGIELEMRLLVDNARAWMQYRSYHPDEIALRFHHKLVFIHPFPNGNGRLSRLIADVLIVKLGGRPFTWGGATDLTDTHNEMRSVYHAALRKADDNEFGDLFRFGRS
jgi:Fic-DOC domain mobile mystery protein B